MKHGFSPSEAAPQPAGRAGNRRLSGAGVKVFLEAARPAILQRRGRPAAFNLGSPPAGSILAAPGDANWEEDSVLSL
jgi:hypothetical protein